MNSLSQRKLGLLAAASALTCTFCSFETAYAVGAEHGSASWYSVETNGGTHTASGQSLRDSAATAAHKTLPLGSKVRVTNLANGRSQVVTITDRGPYVAGRIIDVTIGMAERLGFVNRGVTPVKVETVGSGTISESASAENTAEEREPRSVGGERSGRSQSSSGRRSPAASKGTRRSSSSSLFGGPRRGF